MGLGVWLTAGLSMRGLIRTGEERVQDHGLGSVLTAWRG